MAAGKLNYIVLYKNSSQVFGSASKKIALESAPPEGCSIEDKRVLFVTYEPDNESLSVYQVPQDEVLNAELKEKKTNE
jgi:hypothetical protein